MNPHAATPAATDRVLAQARAAGFTVELQPPRRNVVAVYLNRGDRTGVINLGSRTGKILHSIFWDPVTGTAVRVEAAQTQAYLTNLVPPAQRDT